MQSLDQQWAREEHKETEDYTTDKGSKNQESFH